MAFFITKDDLNYAFRLWLQKWKNDTNCTNLQIAIKTGASPATIGFLLNGQRNVSETKMREMLHSAGFDLKEALRPYIAYLDLSDVEAFKDPDDIKSLQQEVEAEERRETISIVKPKVSITLPIPVENDISPMTNEEMDQNGFIRIPYSAKMVLAAGERGSCIPVTEDEYTSNIVVHGPSLGHHSAKNLQAFKVCGDNMEPVLAQNSIILANTKQNDIRLIRERQIYVVCYDLADGTCSVKYLRWVKGEEGKWLSIESANNFYAVEIRRVEDVALVGEVIWAWRSFPD